MQVLLQCAIIPECVFAECTGVIFSCFIFPRKKTFCLREEEEGKPILHLPKYNNTTKSSSFLPVAFLRGRKSTQSPFCAPAIISPNTRRGGKEKHLPKLLRDSERMSNFMPRLPPPPLTPGVPRYPGSRVGPMVGFSNSLVD